MKKFLFILLTLVFGINPAKADSPLTSTIFHTAYAASEPVKNALANGLDQKALKFLASDGSSAEKLAVINTLGFGNMENVTKFEEYLLKNRKGLKKETFDFLRNADQLSKDTEQTSLMTADDLMCWSYLQGMGDYFHPAQALSGGMLAFNRNAKSMTQAVSLSLIIAQVQFDSNWCAVYMVCKQLLIDKTYETNLVSKEAIDSIMEYIGLYKETCDEVKE